MNTSDAAAGFMDLLNDSAGELGHDLAQSKESVALYMSERAFHLSTITHEPGFGEAVEREAVNVALKAGIEATDTAAAADRKLFGAFAGALRFAALALV